jgi:hypothetical protein
MFRILGLPILLILIGCQPSNHRVSKLKFDSTKIVIFSLDTTTINEERNVELSYLKNNGSPISLTQDEVDLVELRLGETLNKINEDRRIEFEAYKQRYSSDTLTVQNFFLVNLNDYNRQYVPYKSKEGERHVWVNCFCSRTPERLEFVKSNIIMPSGGGSCYFNVTINLSKGIYQDLSVNAPM